MTRHQMMMNTLKFIAALIASTALGCSQVSTPEQGGDSGKKAELKIATFNIRLDTDKDTGEKNWPLRKGNCAALITQYGFDIFGLQEVLANQQADLRTLLPGYRFLFVGRDDGTNGEAVGIAYNPEKVSPVEQGRFWLSPTPDVPSNSLGWGGMNRCRVAVWMRLKDLESGKEFYFLATHLEVNNSGNDYAEIRNKSAELIIQRMDGENADGLPVVIAGDFNPGASDEASLESFRKVYSDAFLVAEAGGFRQGPRATYNGFNTAANMERDSRPDIIFYTPSMELLAYQAIDDRFNGSWPSDHIPVMARLSW